MKLRLWRSDRYPVVLLDSSPTGEEEERNLFLNPVNNPTDLNDVMMRERMQDMDERIIFADRAFLIAILWVIFLICLPILQSVLSFWKFGLTDAQFITVITTTTASVFGFWYLVGRYLFPQPGGGRSAERIPIRHHAPPAANTRTNPR